MVLNLLKQRSFPLFVVIFLCLVIFSGCGTDPSPSIIAEEPSVLVEEEPHSHVWTNGKCAECGEYCPHPAHGREDRICSDCGQQTYHIFDTDHVCVRCGYRWGPVSHYMSGDFYEESSEPGTCIDHEVPVPSLGQQAVKLIQVYLPYAYDPELQYDVVLLYSGIHIPYSSWISDLKWVDRGEDGETLVMKNVYDNMIQRGFCRPMIIVSVSNYTRNSVKGAGGIYNSEAYAEGVFDDYGDTAEATEKDLLPFLVEHYATYAASADPDAIRAARRHFAVGGFSNGAYFTVYGAMRGLQDCVSAFIPVGGSKAGEEVGASLRENWADWPVDLVYFVCGQYDGYASANTYQDYCLIRDACPGLKEGVNLIWDAPLHGHDWECCSVAAFNSLPLLFCWNDL